VWRSVSPVTAAPPCGVARRVRSRLRPEVDVDQRHVGPQFLETPSASALVDALRTTVMPSHCSRPRAASTKARAVVDD
jgi:hypothetical protein